MSNSLFIYFIHLFIYYCFLKIIVSCKIRKCRRVGYTKKCDGINRLSIEQVSSVGYVSCSIIAAMRQHFSRCCRFRSTFIGHLFPNKLSDSPDRYSHTTERSHWSSKYYVVLFLQANRAWRIIYNYSLTALIYERELWLITISEIDPYALSSCIVGMRFRLICWPANRNC